MNEWIPLLEADFMLAPDELEAFLNMICNKRKEKKQFVSYSHLVISRYTSTQAPSQIYENRTIRDGV